MTTEAPGEFERNDPYAPTPDNRPAALEFSPLALTREGASQMSFGERAALEGVLAQLRPAVAIEVGTAEGGSLSRIAAYSEVVHSIDISYAELDGPLPGNVMLHAGRSAEVLPLLLDELASQAKAVDFALVDGDHSFEGVIGDVHALLDSRATDRSVMLVHDSVNAEIRSGLEQVGIEDHGKVVYYEPDFVPGYVYRTGSARNTAWGGLALVICDARRSPAYADSPRQSRYYEPYEAIQSMRRDRQAQGS